MLRCFENSLCYILSEEVQRDQKRLHEDIARKE
jgi:hypothetical protein